MKTKNGNEKMQKKDEKKNMKTKNGNEQRK